MIRQDEQRVIAEAIAALFLKADDAVHIALGPDHAAVGTHQSDGAGVMGAAVVLVLQLFQQQAVVGGVVPVAAAEAGGVDTRGAIQGVHADAAVIRQGAAAGDLGDLPGLLLGVFHEGGAVFDGLVVNARLPHGEDLVEQAAQDGLDLYELVGIVGCDNQFHLCVFFLKIVR